MFELLSSYPSFNMGLSKNRLQILDPNRSVRSIYPISPQWLAVCPNLYLLGYLYISHYILMMVALEF